MKAMSFRTYLDWNATAPIRKEVSQAVSNTMNLWGNPSAIYHEGREAKGLIEKARVTIGEICGFSPEDVIFTSGATESAAMALQDKGLFASAIEHECVKSWTHNSLLADKFGRVEVQSPPDSCLQLANGETGVIQSIPNHLHVSDATQALGKIPTKDLLERVKIAFISAHKIGGLKGVGAILKKPDAEIARAIQGGGQEFGFRSGTENVIGIVAFEAALKAADRDLKDGVWSQVQELRDLFEDTISDAVKDVVVFGKGVERLPNTSYFAASGWKSEHQIINLDLAGFAVSAGSACSSGKLHSSGVLEAMGIDPYLIKSAVRVSLGPTTTKDEILKFAQVWIKKLKGISD